MIILVLLFTVDTHTVDTHTVDTHTHSLTHSLTHPFIKIDAQIGDCNIVYKIMYDIFRFEIKSFTTATRTKFVKYL